jgi:hypothetical protein
VRGIKNIPLPFYIEQLVVNYCEYRFGKISPCWACCGCPIEETCDIMLKQEGYEK